jgi:ribose/xylose/arabinose/galactoside ABC-type transport system permease subunit
MKQISPRMSSIFKRQEFFLILVIIGISVVASIVNPRFASTGNLLNILQQISVLGIITMAMAILLLGGMLDLSYSGMIGLSTVLITFLVLNGVSFPIALIIGVLVCISGGALNGFIVSKTGAEPLIITLGMMYIYQGIALVVTQGRFLTLEAEFTFLGRGKVLGIPFSVYVLILVTIGAYLFIKYTVFGRRLLSIGGNQQAAFLAGIRVIRNKVLAYTMCGGLCALASLVLLSRLGSVLAEAGSGYSLRALAAAIIGGVTFEGARGTIGGVFLGVILLGLVNNSLNIMGVSSYYQTATLGAIIVIAVVVSHITKR